MQHVWICLATASCSCPSADTGTPLTALHGTQEIARQLMKRPSVEDMWINPLCLICALCHYPAAAA